MIKLRHIGCGLFVSSAILAVQCGDDEPPPPPPQEQTGMSCTVASECYTNLDGAALQGGPAYCLARVMGGYCTHECTKDEDCCAIQGECRTSLKQVCAPFESTGKKYCFLSCEDADIRAAADAGLDAAVPSDPEAYCHAEVFPDFTCRSTGGGSENRKVCVPGGTAVDGGNPPPDTYVPPSDNYVPPADTYTPPQDAPDVQPSEAGADATAG
jgi:hypothetical protein